MCCCGCSLGFGVNLILAVHLAIISFYVLASVFSIVYKRDGWEYSGSHTLEVCVAAACLAGLPIIMLAFWGAAKKVETHLRFYFVYLLLSVIIDSIFVYRTLLAAGPCERLAAGGAGLPPSDVPDGQAFVCGMSRFFGSAAAILVTASQLYAAFIVWSFCEYLADGRGADIGDLLNNSERAAKLKLKNSPYAGLLGYANNGYGSIFAAAAPPGIGGSTPIFGDGQQELEYPLPAR